MLNLRQLIAIVSDDVERLREMHPAADAVAIRDMRFTAVEKRSIANRMMTRLMDPQGAANFRAEEEARHAANRALRAEWAAYREKTRRKAAAEQGKDEDGGNHDDEDGA